MRKIIIALLISILVFSMASCDLLNSTGGDENENGGSQIGDTPSDGDDSLGGDDSTSDDADDDTDDGIDETEDIYSRLAGLIGKAHDSVTLDITSTTAYVSLSAKYELSSDEIRYTVEKLNRISLDGTASNPEGYKTTLTGVAEVENGVIVSINGDAVELPEYTELRGAFNLDEECFTEVKDENGVFTAKITDPDRFYGRDVDINGASITVVYTESAVVSITLRYNTPVATVVSVYSF